MISKLSYILEHKKIKVKLCEEKSTRNNTICTWTFKQTLMHHFNLSNEHCKIDDTGVIFTIIVDDTQSYWNGLTITVHQLPQYTFMDVSVAGLESHNIEVLETFDSVLIEQKYIVTYSGHKQCIAEDYDIIKTYDSVSSYYCNLLYPKLDEFDRKMRLLLYNTYYLVYGSEFPYKFKYYCPDQKLKQRKAKSCGTEPSSYAFFYAYDYTQLINILFVDKRRAPDGSEKTDWELYFANKIQFSNSEKDIKDIKEFRDKIAHCKLFSKSDYEKTTLLLDKYCVALNKAIALTYNNDFFNEFINSFKKTLKMIADHINELGD